MKKVGNHKSTSRNFLSLALMLTFSLTSSAQEAAPDAAADQSPAAAQGGIL
jgi:hypothetical protein